MFFGGDGGLNTREEQITMINNKKNITNYTELEGGGLYPPTWGFFTGLKNITALRGTLVQAK